MAAKPSPGSPDALFARNRWTFSVGTLGRDMVYTLVSLYLIVYLTEVLNASDTFMWWAGWLILAARLFDAVMDIVMGSIVDNTRSRWGHYKPWIAAVAIASAVCTLMLFTDLQLPDGAYVAVFALLYLLWGLTWTMNDIPYWALLPALTLDQSSANGSAPWPRSSPPSACSAWWWPSFRRPRRSATTPGPGSCSPRPW